MNSLGIWENTISIENLLASWQRVRRNKGAPGVDGVTVPQFEDLLEVNIHRLHDTLMNNCYTPSPVTKVSIKTSSSKVRFISILTVADRVVHYAVARTLTPLFDPLFSDISYAFRPSRSAVMAAEKLSSHIISGKVWVLRADIRNFFDSLDHDLLVKLLAKSVNSEQIVCLVEKMLKGYIFQNMSIYEIPTGAFQGSPLSPLLSNIYLTPFDNSLTEEGFAAVRYCDDIVVAADRKEQIDDALSSIENHLTDIRLELNNDKLWQGHTGSGFDFLGYHFNLQGKGPARKAIAALHERIETIKNSADAAAETKKAIKVWTNYFGSLQSIEINGLELFYPVLSVALEMKDDVTVTSLIKQREKIPVGDAATHLKLAELWMENGYEFEAIQEAVYALSIDCRNEKTEESVSNILQIPGELVRQLSSLSELLCHNVSEENLKNAASIIAEKGGYNLASIIHDKAIKVRSTSVSSQNSLIENAECNLMFTDEDINQFLELFEGREGIHSLEHSDSCGTRIVARVDRTLMLEDIRDHLEGKRTVGIYPLMMNNTSRFLVFDIDVSKKAILAGSGRFDSDKSSSEINKTDSESLEQLLQAAFDYASRLFQCCNELNLDSYLEFSGYRGYHVWLFFSVPVKASDLIKLGKMIMLNAGLLPNRITNEIFPAQDRLAEGKTGSPIKLPLGLHVKNSKRSLFLDQTGRAVLDQAHFVRNIKPVDIQLVLSILYPDNIKVNVETAVRFDNSSEIMQRLFVDIPLTKRLVQGCPVVMFFIKKAVDTSYLTHNERFFLLNTLGHLGAEGEKALHLVISKCMNYSKAVTDRYISKRYNYPISCARIRENYKELTASLECGCRFRLPKGGYPSPVLHAVKAESVDGMKEKMKHVKLVTKNRPGDAPVDDSKEEVQNLLSKISTLKKHKRDIDKKVEKYGAILADIFNNLKVDKVEIESGMLVMKQDENGKPLWHVEI